MDAAVNDLYAAPLEEFVERRNALVRALRGTGEREAADEVRSLRKPTVAAWALNQLVRRHASEVERFLEIAERLRHIQVRALGSDISRGEMRATSSAYRDALEELGRHAATILQEVSSSAAPRIGEVTASLQAAAVDDEARHQLREGTLTRPFPAPGLAALTSVLPPDQEVEPTASESHPAGRETGREEEAAARLARDEARGRRHEAQRRLRVVERAAERLTQRAATSEERAQRLAQAAADAAREAREVRQRADAATEEVRLARSELDEAEQLLEEAGRDADG